MLLGITGRFSILSERTSNCAFTKNKGIFAKKKTMPDMASVEFN
jgi:hypothetical protein